MMGTDLWRWQACDLAHAIRTRHISAREAVAACLARLEAVNPQINAVVDLMAEDALAEADRADRAVRAVSRSVRCTACQSQDKHGLCRAADHQRRCRLQGPHSAIGQSGNRQLAHRRRHRHRTHQCAAVQCAIFHVQCAARAHLLRAAGLAQGGSKGLELLRDSVASLRNSPALLERAHSLAEFGVHCGGKVAVPSRANRSLRVSTSLPVAAPELWQGGCRAKNSKRPARRRDASGVRTWKR